MPSQHASSLLSSVNSSPSQLEIEVGCGFHRFGTLSRLTGHPTPHVACFAHFWDPSRGAVHVLHRTPRSAAVLGADGVALGFRVCVTEATHPFGRWWSVLARNAEHHLADLQREGEHSTVEEKALRTTPLTMLRHSSTKASSTTTTSLLTAPCTVATVWWDEIMQRYALAASAALLNSKGFVQWLVERCDLAGGSFDIFVDGEDAGFILAQNELDPAEYNVIYDKAQHRLAIVPYTDPRTRHDPYPASRRPGEHQRATGRHTCQLM